MIRPRKIRCVGTILSTGMMLCALASIAAPSGGSLMPPQISGATLTPDGQVELSWVDPNDSGGRYAIESYLDYHGEKLAHRFDANTYITLSQAMNHHDVGRGRGGIAAALRRITGAVTIAGISSDRLYPLRLQQELADLIPTAEKLTVIDSLDGHDGFLTEHEQVSALIRSALAD